jgi:hypothetical protein
VDEAESEVHKSQGHVPPPGLGVDKICDTDLRRRTQAAEVAGIQADFVLRIFTENDQSKYSIVHKRSLSLRERSKSVSQENSKRMPVHIHYCVIPYE